MNKFTSKDIAEHWEKQYRETPKQNIEKRLSVEPCWPAQMPWIFLLPKTLCKTDIFLEVGCGIGEEINMIFQSIKECYGFDISKTAIRYAKKRFKAYPNIHLSVASNLNKYPDNFFDIIYSETVFMHMIKEDVEKYFKEFFYKLKDDGFIFVQFLYNPPAGTECNFTKGEPANPVTSWSREEIIQLVERNGFKIHNLSERDISWQVHWEHPYSHLWLACIKPQNKFIENWKKENWGEK